MISDTLYEFCLPILNDESIEEEEKTDKLEELLRNESTLSGRPLADAILSALWRHRDSSIPQATSPPARHTVARRGSPAPWQIARSHTPIGSPALAGASPASSHGFGIVPPPFNRTLSSTASPFTSPRPSPRLAFTSPIPPLPHSPSLMSYEFSAPSREKADYGDLGSDTVDWLVNEDSLSRPTSSAGLSTGESTLSGAAATWVQPQHTDMSPYDMLRSILGESKTDEEIETSLEANSYDLSATIMALMGSQNILDEQNHVPVNEGQIIVGKSLLPSQPISISQSNTQGRSNVMCKYWMATGNCLRADCRFSHEFGTTICR